MLGFLKALFEGRPQPGPAQTGSCALPSPPDADSYRTQLADILDAHSDQALCQIRGALAHLGEKTQGLQIGIHPDQEGEGTFSVMLHVSGPDHYVRNKEIADYRLLFEIKRVPGGLNVAVPLFDPDEVAYEVNDVLADVAADWAERLWRQACGSHPDLPVMIFCHDDWGQTTPRWLQKAPA